MNEFTNMPSDGNFGPTSQKSVQSVDSLSQIQEKDISDNYKKGAEFDIAYMQA